MAMDEEKRKKRLSPKSGVLFHKYRRELKFVLAGLVIVLTVLVLGQNLLSHNDYYYYDDDDNDNDNGGYNSADPNAQFASSSKVESAAKNGQRPADYVMPFTDMSQGVTHPLDDGVREKAAMVTLTRNFNLWELVHAIRDVEDRFNHRYHYDWVFLNEEPFTEEFIRVTTALVSGKTKYGLIPKEHWQVPSDIDSVKFKQARDELEKQEVLYGESIPYRQMCRYQTGFFWQHPLLDEYEYYWRVDHDISIFCDIQYDIFKFMKQNKKKYGFILSVTEYEATIKNLWPKTKEFIAKNPKYVAKNNLLKFISDDGGETFNRCHFWTNFEVASLDFYRSKAYRDYFDFLDKSGGFFYERWGDAPIHSIAASLFLDKSEVHFFDGLGFHHPDFFSCPVEEKVRLQNKCVCEPAKDDTWHDHYFCTRQYFKAGGYLLPLAVQKKF